MSRTRPFHSGLQSPVPERFTYVIAPAIVPATSTRHSLRSPGEMVAGASIFKKALRILLRPADMSSVHQAWTSVLEPTPVEIAIPQASVRVARIPVPPLGDLETVAVPSTVVNCLETGTRSSGPLDAPRRPPVLGSALPIPKIPDSLSCLGIAGPGPLFKLGMEVAPQSPAHRGGPASSHVPFPAARPFEPNTPLPPGSDFRVLGYRTLPYGAAARIWRVLSRYVPENGHRSWVLVGAGLALVLAAGLSLPRVAGARVVKANNSEPSGLLASSLNSLKQGIAGRAGLQLMDDFRSGFDNWVGEGDPSSTWIFDQTGFVQPNQLAIYRPSLGLSDYTMEFLGELDQKALSWVFRASDIKNYYVAKLVMTTPGPLPALALRRYAVVRGKATKATDTILPVTVRGSNTFQVRLEARGPNFSVYIGDKLAAFWIDSRLSGGGVGFFSSRGENSRIRWVRVEHQYDVLGRICAYLSPSAVASLNSRLNESWK